MTRPRLEYTTELIHTLRFIVIWHSPIAVQRNSNLAALGRLELLTIDLHGISVREDNVVADAVGFKVQYQQTFVELGVWGWVWVVREDTHIQGSVELSPSGDLLRSEDLPGAKTPRP